MAKVVFLVARVSGGSAVDVAVNNRGVVWREGLFVKMGRTIVALCPPHTHWLASSQWHPKSPSHPWHRALPSDDMSLSNKSWRVNGLGDLG